MDARQLYDLHAAANRTSLEQMAPTSARSTQLIARLRGVLARRAMTDPTVVEVGIGDGELCCELARLLPSARVVGSDIAAGRVEALAERARLAGVAERVTGLVVDADQGLSARLAAPADVVVAIDVMEHVFDVFAFVRDLALSVRVGGLLVLRVPNVAYIKRRVDLLLGRLPVTASWFGPDHDLSAWRDTWGWDGGHLHLFTHATLSSLLADAGFVPIECFDPGSRFARLREAFPGLLLGNLCVVAERVR